MILWEEDAKRKNVQALIDYLLEFHFDSGFGRFGDIKSTIAFAEMVKTSKKHSLDEFMASFILQDMSRSGKKSIGDFELLYEQKYKQNRSLAQNDGGDWKFFIPIEISLASDITRPPRLKLLGKKFSIVTWKTVERQVDKETRRNLRDPVLLSEMTSINIARLSSAYLTVRGKGVSGYSAWREIEPAFEALRGLIEFYLNGFQTTITFIGVRRPLRKIPHPLWMLAYKKGNSPESFRFVIDSESGTESFQLTRSILDKLQRNSQFLRNVPKPNSTLELISDCLRLYAQAMDARFEYQCFLGLWQLAEAITRSETIGGKTDDVVKRLAWHGQTGKFAGSGYTESLKAFGKMRNDIVHKGIHDVEENDMNILKYVCELALLWLINVRKSLPTIAHLEQFYQLRTLSDADLKTRSATVTYVRKQR